jgi:hypothetical protein
MLKCLIALTSLLSAAVLAAPAWTWVDAQGRRHYSDRPVPGATQIELSESQTFSAGPARPAAGQPATDEESAATDEESADPGYSVLDIVSPTQEETLHNIEGNLGVRVATNPGLKSGHRIDAILDGQRRALGVRSLDFTLTEVFRGEHTLQILIVDSAGREVVRSAPVTFFVRQTSVN